MAKMSNASSQFYTTSSTTYYKATAASDNGAWRDDITYGFNEPKSPDKSVPLIKTNDEVAASIVKDEDLLKTLQNEGVLILYGTDDKNAKTAGELRSKIFPMYRITSGLLRYSTLYTPESDPQAIGYWPHFVLYAADDRIFSSNLFRYLFYISLYYKGGVSSPKTLMIIELTSSELSKFKEFAPDVGLGIESILEMAKFENDRLLIKLLGRWNLKRR